MAHCPNLEVLSLGSQVEGVATFDVRRARCFDDQDTARLQNVIQAAGYENINRLVEGVFPPAIAGRIQVASAHIPGR